MQGPAESVVDGGGGVTRNAGVEAADSPGMHGLRGRVAFWAWRALLKALSRAAQVVDNSRTNSGCRHPDSGWQG